MRSPQLSLTLVPSGKSLTTDCDGCRDLRSSTPILFDLLCEFFGIIEDNETETDEFMLKYHLNGHRLFVSMGEQKQLTSDTTKEISE